MLRYIKVNNTWIDTLAALRDDNIAYCVIDGIVLIADTEEIIGKLEDEKDYEIHL